MPSLRSEAMRSRHLPRSQNVRPQASPGCTGRCEVSAGSDENGCVDHACSPATWLAGTGFSVIGNSGCPRVRSNTYSMPVLVAWMTAGAGARGLCEIPLGRRRVRGGIRQRIEGPQLRAALRVVGADDTALNVGRAVVADGGTHYHRIAADGGRGGHQVCARIANAHSARQIDLAAIAEVSARATGFRIEC